LRLGAHHARLARNKMSVDRSEARRPRRSRLYIAIGAILAVLAFAAAATIASLPLLQTNNTGTRVVIAKHDIKARTVIQESDLDLGSYNPPPPLAFFAIKDVKGKGARVDIPASSPLTANMVAASSDLLSTTDVAYLPIPKGYVAVTVPTSEQVGVGGYIQATDRISLLATVNTALFGKSPGTSVVRTVFRDVYVIKVGPAANTQATSPTLTSSLTLVMTSCDSEFLFWLLNNATMKYELESYKDYGAAPADLESKCQITGVGPAQVDTRWKFTSP
jgi:Flp pilus assembly protein CpaB